MTKEERLNKRHSAEKRFRFYGLASIFVALLFVLILVNNIFSKGSSAFMKTAINVEVFFDPELLEVKNGSTLDEIQEAEKELNKDDLNDQKRFLLNHKVEILKSISIN